jgi:hypothetical protein
LQCLTRVIVWLLREIEVEVTTWGTLNEKKKFDRETSTQQSSSESGGKWNTMLQVLLEKACLHRRMAVTEWLQFCD